MPKMFITENRNDFIAVGSHFGAPRFAAGHDMKSMP